MNPFALWTHLMLRTGEAMLDSMQAAAARARPAKVAVISTPDAPPHRPRARRKAKAKAKPKPGTKAKRQAKRSRRRS
jgi:hypothetical protein